MLQEAYEPCPGETMVEELADCHELECLKHPGHKNGHVISSRFAMILPELFYPGAGRWRCCDETYTAHPTWLPADCPDHACVSASRVDAVVGHRRSKSLAACCAPTQSTSCCCVQHGSQETSPSHRPTYLTH